MKRNKRKANYGPAWYGSHYGDRHIGVSISGVEKIYWWDKQGNEVQTSIRMCKVCEDWLSD